MSGMAEALGIEILKDHAGHGPYGCPWTARIASGDKEVPDITGHGKTRQEALQALRRALERLAAAAEPIDAWRTGDGGMLTARRTGAEDYTICRFDAEGNCCCSTFSRDGEAYVRMWAEQSYGGLVGKRMRVL